MSRHLWRLWSASQQCRLHLWQATFSQLQHIWRLLVLPRPLLDADWLRWLDQGANQRLKITVWSELLIPWELQSEGKLEVSRPLKRTSQARRETNSLLDKLRPSQVVRHYRETQRDRRRERVRYPYDRRQRLNLGRESIPTTLLKEKDQELPGK